LSLFVRGIVDYSLYCFSLVYLACSKETLPLSSLLLGEVLGKKVAWCALEELLPVTSRPIAKLWASLWENEYWESTCWSSCPVRESLGKYSLEELFPMSNRPVAQFWDSYWKKESLLLELLGSRESLGK
jgi:hypothetical protein